MYAFQEVDLGRLQIVILSVLQFENPAKAEQFDFSTLRFPVLYFQARFR